MQVFTDATSQTFIPIKSQHWDPLLPSDGNMPLEFGSCPPSTMEGVCSPCAGTGAQTSSAGIPAGVRASAWAKERARTQLLVLADGRN